MPVGKAHSLLLLPVKRKAFISEQNQQKFSTVQELVINVFRSELVQGVPCGVEAVSAQERHKLNLSCHLYAVTLLFKATSVFSLFCLLSVLRTEAVAGNCSITRQDARAGDAFTRTTTEEQGAAEGRFRQGSGEGAAPELGSAGTPLSDTGRGAPRRTGLCDPCGSLPNRAAARCDASESHGAYNEAPSRPRRPRPAPPPTCSRTLSIMEATM